MSREQKTVNYEPRWALRTAIVIRVPDRCETTELAALSGSGSDSPFGSVHDLEIDDEDF